MGIVMHAGLVCQGCDKLVECGQGINGGPDGVTSGPLVCGECGGKMILLTFGVVEREPTIESIRRFNIERWPFRGLWYRPSSGTTGTPKKGSA